MSLPLLVKKDGKLHFEEGNLVKTLQHSLIGEKPIAIVSVAGPSRMGKSFFLNLVHKYYLEKGWKNRNKIWLEDFDSSKDCTIKWRPGTKSHTQGIVILETPLIVEKSDGSKIAVILLDTQDNFENGSGKEESLAVFALSMLFSSLQIFNLSKLIQSVDMEYLEFFVNYTVKSKKNSRSNSEMGQLEEENTKYFQDLAFLVRDWPNFMEHSYGDEGGKEYLKSIGENSEHYKSIENTFERFFCYLMPEPGSKVRKASKNANLTMKDLGDDFTTHLNQFAEKLLHPDVLSTKAVRPNVLVSFMKDYAKVVLNGNYLEFPTMMKMMAEHEIKRAVEYVRHDFEENMTRVITNIDISDDLVWEHYETNLMESLEQAKKKHKDIFDFESSGDGNDQLVGNIRLSVDKLKIEMQQKRLDYIKSSMKSWRDDSIKFLESEDTRDSYANRDRYETILEECINRSPKRDIRDSEAAAREHKQYSEDVKRAHQKRRQELEGQHVQAIQNACETFEESMTAFIANIDETQNSVWENYDSFRDELAQVALTESLRNSPFENDTNGENEIRNTLGRYKETFDEEMKQKRDHYFKLRMSAWVHESINSLKSHEKGFFYTNPSQYDKIFDDCKSKSIKPLQRDSQETGREHERCLQKVKEESQKIQEEAHTRNNTTLRYAVGGATVAAALAAVPAVAGITAVGTVATPLLVGGTTGVASFIAFVRTRWNNLHKKEEKLKQK